MVAFNTEYKTPEDLRRLAVEAREAQSTGGDVVAPKQIEVQEREQAQPEQAEASHSRTRYRNSSTQHNHLPFVIGGGVVAAALIIVIIFASGLLAPKSPTLVAITVAQQADGESLIDDLYSKHIIADKEEFRKLLTENKLYSAVLPGLYNLPENAELAELIPLLQRGPDNYLLTLPEGLTVQQTASRIHDSIPKISSSEIIALANEPSQFSNQFAFVAGLSTLEGYLFPATYRFINEITAYDVIEILLQKFDDSTASLRSSALSNTLSAAGLNFNDAIIIASLIERETANKAERASIASVIYNRLELGMHLQIDATIVYALQQSPTGYDGHPLLYSDLEINTPYNTYLFAGLPVGPIASPSLECIQAAMTPANTNYLYYVLSEANDGTHVFCATEAEFEVAKARYNAAFGIY